MSSTTTLKTVYNKDIRRVVLVVPTFEELRTVLTSTYSLPLAPASFSVKWLDDESDLLTINSDMELLEALRAAVEEGNTLKLFIESVPTKTSPAPAPVPAPTATTTAEAIAETSKTPTGEKGETREETKKTVSFFSSFLPVAGEDESPDKPPLLPEDSQAPTQQGTQDTKAANEKATTSVLDMEELPHLAAAFFSDSAVQAALPGALDAALAAIGEKKPALDVLHSFLDTSEAIAQHPSTQIVVPALLRQEDDLTCVDKVIQEADPAMLAMAQQLLPLLTPMLPSLFEQCPPSGAFTLGNLGLGSLDPLGAIVNMMDPPTADPAKFSTRCCRPSTHCPCPSTSTGPREAKQEQPKDTVWTHVQCDGCDRIPIVGTRFKCTVCPDFDLCADCEAADLHPASHPLLKQKTTKPPSPKDSVHHGITCDGCSASPLCGPRYKCTVCPDYDLCGQCEAKGDLVHPTEHPLLKLNHPSTPAVNPPHPLRARRVHSRPRVSLSQHRDQHFKHLLMQRIAQQQQQQQQRYTVLKQRLAQQQRQRCKRWAMQKKAGRCLKLPPGCAERNRLRKQASLTVRDKRAKLDAKFVSDGNLVDGSVVQGGAILVKVWHVVNNGSESWPEGSKLIFLRGDREIVGDEEFPVSSAVPGEKKEVSAVLLTPERPGKYSAYFQLTDKDRNRFGNRVWVQIEVPEQETVEEEEAKQEATEEVKEEANEEVKEAKEEAKEEAEEKAKEGAKEVTQEEPKTANDPDIFDDPQKYDIQLNALEAMGFTKRDLNLFLLEEHDGNVQIVVQWLLQKVAGV